MGQQRHQSGTGVRFVVGEDDGHADLGVTASVGTLHTGEGGAAGAGQVDHDLFGSVFAESAPVATGTPVGVTVPAGVGTAVHRCAVRSVRVAGLPVRYSAWM
jgi:hypothetical protein